MEWLLRWQTLVFLAPLAFGVALVSGLAFGLGADADGDADTDVEADLDSDAKVHLDAHGNGLLGLLGVGRVPLSMLLLTLSILFGAVGLAVSALLQEKWPDAYGPISVAVALFVALVGTGRIASFVARVAPTTETYRVRRQDLVGRVGHAIVELTDGDGFAQVKDHEGNVQQVRVRTDGPVIAKGTSILVVDYSREGGWYLVAPYDADATDLASTSRPAVAVKTATRSNS